MRKALLVMSLFALSACNSVLGPGESGELRRAEAKWEAANIDDYNYEMRESCFCPPEANQWAVVEVRNGQIVGGHYLDGKPIPANELVYRRTVEQLFEFAKSRDSWIDDIDFEFDSEFGYPTEVAISAKANIADAGVVYSARNLVKVPVATL